MIPKYYKNLSSWVKVQNFKNPEHKKFISFVYNIVPVSSLNGKLSIAKLKINQRSYYIQPNSGF